MNKKKHAPFKKSFPKRDSFKELRTPRAILLEEVNKDAVGDTVFVEGIVDSVAQTSGPTLFSVSDGTGTLVLKGFSSPGQRTYPEIEEGSVVRATVQINEYNGAFEGEIFKINKLIGEFAEQFRKKTESILRERATPKEVEFLVKSPILDKLKDRFIKAATEIRLAILQSRPIIVRHHNDTDGYSSGFALERAILPLIEKHHGGGKSAWEFYTRAPCAAPFYEIDDSIRDTAHSLANAAKFSNKIPLVIIADNGCSPEDLFAIQQGKIHGLDFIVIDHHFFDTDVISPEVLVNINPFLVGENGNQFSAGMLCTELARFINPVENIEQIPAMAGLADRIDNPQIIADYIKIAERHGYSRELLEDISTVIDFVSAKLRFMEAREYIEVVFGEPKDKQKSLVKLMAPYIKSMESKGLTIAKSAAKVEKIGKTTLQLLPVEETFSRGFYPKPGRSIGLLHDHVQKNKITNLVSVGVLQDAFTIRATDEANFSVHDLITYAQKHQPLAFVEGGGHKNAGAIKFLPSKKEEMISILRDFIKSRQN